MLNHNYDWDMAGVSLSRPVAALSGWYGTGYNTDSFFSTTTFRNAGYPGGLLYDGADLYYWQGLFDLMYAGRVCHLNQRHPGRSGSGTYHNASGVNYT